MRIVLDVDGVVANFVDGAREKCFQMFGVDIGEAKKWNWMEDTLTKEEIKKFWRTVQEDVEFWDGLKVLPWAEELVVRCRALGDVLFCTSRNIPQRWSQQWIDDVLGSRVGMAHLSCIGVRGNTEIAKWHICEGWGADILIDDKPQTVDYINVQSANTVGWLLQAPYNLDATCTYKDSPERMIKRLWEMQAK